MNEELKTTYPAEQVLRRMRLIIKELPLPTGVALTSTARSRCS